jgi:hypothetical protein
MKKYFLLIFTIVITSCVVGQINFKKNDIYLEAGGNGLFGSVNYERQLTNEPGLGVRLGIGFYTENAFYLTIPVGINYLFKLKNSRSFIDAGLGVTWTREEGTFIGSNSHYKGDDFVNFIPSIGYRRHTSKNVMWRINLTPVINKFSFTPWLGASIGKRF